MSYIKTWVERCDEHPDHQSGMVSNGMIQARMQEEIDDLREALAIQQGCCDGAAAQDAHIRREREEHRAEIEKQRAEIERLRADRRERIATAALNGLIANAVVAHTPAQFALAAVVVADALIAELDKEEGKP